MLPFGSPGNPRLSRSRLAQLLEKSLGEGRGGDRCPVSARRPAWLVSGSRSAGGNSRSPLAPESCTPEHAAQPHRHRPLPGSPLQKAPRFCPAASAAASSAPALGARSPTGASSVPSSSWETAPQGDGEDPRLRHLRPAVGATWRPRRRKPGRANASPRRAARPRPACDAPAGSTGSGRAASTLL